MASGNKKENYGGAARYREGTAARNKTNFIRRAAEGKNISRSVKCVDVLIYVAWQLCLERTCVVVRLYVTGINLNGRFCEVEI